MKKEELNELMNASIKSHEQREDAKRKLKHLRAGAEQDFRQFTNDIKEEERLAFKEFQMKQFMELKGMKRLDKKRLASNSIGPMRREVGSFLNTAKYSWSRMKEITGQNDLDIMLQELKELDLGNFALYQLLNNMDNIMAKESEELENIQKELLLHQKAIEYGDEDQKSILARINSDMESELAICESNKTKLKISKSQFAGIIAGVNALINDLGLDFKVNHTWELLDGLAHIEASINTLKAAKAHCIYEEDPLNDRAIKNILIHEESYPIDPATANPAMVKRPIVLKAPSLSQYQITKKKQIHTDDGQTLIVEVEAKDAYGVYTDPPPSMCDIRERIKSKMIAEAQAEHERLRLLKSNNEFSPRRMSHRRTTIHASALHVGGSRKDSTQKSMMDPNALEELRELSAESHAQSPLSRETSQY